MINSKSLVAARSPDEERDTRLARRRWWSVDSSLSGPPSELDP